MKRFLYSGTADEPAEGVPADVVCIYDTDGDPDDYGPVIDPDGHIDRIVFHSDLEYLRVHREGLVESTDPGMSAISMPAATLVDGTVTLFAHGLDYIPLIGGDIKIDGEWQPCGGQAMVFLWSAGLGQFVSVPTWIGFSADATNVYMFARGFDTAANSIDWRVRIYAEAFDDLGEAAYVFRIAPGAAEFGSLGKIDTDHRFVRQSPDDPGAFRFLGLPTLMLDVQNTGYGDMICINTSTGALDGSYPTLTDRPLPTPHLTVEGVECEIEGDVSAGPAFLIGDEKVEMRAPDGELVFTTDYAMQAGLSHLSGSLVLASHNPPGGTAYDTIHVADHDLGPAPAGATRMMGFARVVEGADFAPLAACFQIAGSFVLQGRKLKRTGYTPTIADLQFISPVISGGRVLMRETWFTHGDVMESSTQRVLPSLTIDYHLFPVAFLGGA